MNHGSNDVIVSPLRVSDNAYFSTMVTFAANIRHLRGSKITAIMLLKKTELITLPEMHQALHYSNLLELYHAF